LSGQAATSYLLCHHKLLACHSGAALDALDARPVAVRKDDAPAAVQAAIANVAGSMAFSGGGGLIQTTPG